MTQRNFIRPQISIRTFGVFTEVVESKRGKSAIKILFRCSTLLQGKHINYANFNVASVPTKVSNQSKLTITFCRRRVQLKYDGTR